MVAVSFLDFHFLGRYCVSCKKLTSKYMRVVISGSSSRTRHGECFSLSSLPVADLLPDHFVIFISPGPFSTFLFNPCSSWKRILSSAHLAAPHTLPSVTYNSRSRPSKPPLQMAGWRASVRGVGKGEHRRGCRHVPWAPRSPRGASSGCSSAGLCKAPSLRCPTVSAQSTGTSWAPDPSSPSPGLRISAAGKGEPVGVTWKW